MNDSTLSCAPLSCAKALRPFIESCADQIERERQLPAELVDRLLDEGLFRLLLPDWLGGQTVAWPMYLQVVEEIAAGDGSTGWCFNQANVFATTAARVPTELAKMIWGDERSIVGNGPPARTESIAVPDGYRLSGRWMFSSGCRHANWMAAVSVENGAEQRLHMLPKSDVELIDVWQVQGLRGTGSFHFQTDNVFVPEALTATVTESNPAAGPMFAIPRNLLFACGFAAVALGVARAGLDATVVLAKSKTAQFAKHTLARDPVVQLQMGQAEAIWRAAKALLHDTSQTVWKSVCESGDITLDERISLRLASTHAIREAAKAVDVVYNLTGSHAVFSSTAVQRRFQDAHAITQQIQGREAHYGAAGQFLLGEQPVGVF